MGSILGAAPAVRSWLCALISNPCATAINSTRLATLAEAGNLDCSNIGLGALTSRNATNGVGRRDQLSSHSDRRRPREVEPGAVSPRQEGPRRPRLAWLALRGLIAEMPLATAAT